LKITQIACMPSKYIQVQESCHTKSLPIPVAVLTVLPASSGGSSGIARPTSTKITYDICHDVIKS